MGFKKFNLFLGQTNDNKKINYEKSIILFYACYGNSGL